jgi:predicted Zn-dependent protease with MMP-like domain
MYLTHREFHDLVRRAYGELPGEIASYIENVAILVEDWPGRYDLEEAGLQGRHSLFGLYKGIPLPEREGGLPPLPDTITLFRRPIESACAYREEVAREIRVTLLHEVGHYLGMDEDDLERLGYA